MRHVGPVLTRMLLLCSLAGCTDDLETRYNGRARIIEGEFRVITSFATGEEEYALVVDEGDQDEPLLILPFDGSEACDAPYPAAAYFLIDTAAGMRVGLYDTDDASEPRNLRVVDERCNTLLPTQSDVLDVDFRSHFFLFEQSGLESSGPDEPPLRLSLYEPSRESTTPITSKLRQRGSLVDRGTIEPFDCQSPGGCVANQPDAFWLWEEDELVLRDLIGRALQRVGKGVTDIAVGAGDDEMIFSDSEGVHRLRFDGSPPERIGEPGCGLRYERLLFGGSTSYLATMYSPCEDRRLVTIGPQDEVETFAERVRSHFRLQLRGAQGTPETWTFYSTRHPDHGDEELRHFIVSPDGTEEELGVPVDDSRLLYPLSSPGRRDRVWLILTDDDSRRLGTWSAETGFREIARGVDRVVSSPVGMLALLDLEPAEESDREVGTLVMLDGDELTPIADSVPARGLISLRGSPPPQSLDAALEQQLIRSADSVIHDFDGEIGRLSLIQPSGRLELLARDVPLARAGAYETPIRGSQLAGRLTSARVLVYIEDFDPRSDAGTLSVLLPQRDALTISKGVTSHAFSSNRGRTGLLYSIAEGEDKGVWFARQ